MITMYNNKMFIFTMDCCVSVFNTYFRDELLLFRFCVDKVKCHAHKQCTYPVYHEHYTVNNLL